MVFVGIWYFLRSREELDRYHPLMSMAALVRFFSSIQSPLAAVELLITSLITTASGLIPGSATPGPPLGRLLGRQAMLWLSGLLGSCTVGNWLAVGSRTTSV